MKKIFRRNTLFSLMFKSILGRIKFIEHLQLSAGEDFTINLFPEYIIHKNRLVKSGS